MTARSSTSLRAVQQHVISYVLSKNLLHAPSVPSPQAVGFSACQFSIHPIHCFHDFCPLSQPSPNRGVSGFLSPLERQGASPLGSHFYNAHCIIKVCNRNYFVIVIGKVRFIFFKYSHFKTNIYFSAEGECFRSAEQNDLQQFYIGDRNYEVRNFTI